MKKNWKEDLTDNKGNWNVAQDFSSTKIMRHLLNIDRYIETANFGVIHLEDEFSVNEEMKKQARMKSLKRLAKTLEMLINNTYFAVNVESRRTFDEDKKILIEIQTLIPQLQTTIRNQQSKTTLLKIDEKKFEGVLRLLEKIHQELLIPLNKANLIFNYIDEYDPDSEEEKKQKIIDDLSEGRMGI